MLNVTLYVQGASVVSFLNENGAEMEILKVETFIKEEI